MTDPSKATEDEDPQENEKLLCHEDNSKAQVAIIEKKVR